MRDLEISGAAAGRWLDGGSLGVADLVARQGLKKDAGDLAAWGALAGVARAVGEGLWAREFEGRARGEAAPKLGIAEDGQAVAPGVAPKYLLIKAWGNGFCSDLDHTLGHLLLAEMTGRTPVVHWGRNSLFGRDPEGDAFGEFFEPVSPLRIDDLIGKGFDFFPAKWNDANLRQENNRKLAGEGSRLPGIAFLNRPERVAVADYHAGVVALLPWLRPGHWLFGESVEGASRKLVAKYLRLRPAIAAEVEAFAAARFTQRPVIAAHIRGSDKEKEDPQLAQKIALYPRVIQHLSTGSWFWSLFLLTDSEPIREQFAGMFPGNMIATDCVRTSTKTGLHYQGLPDRVRLGVEVVRDAWLAARCDAFVGMGSSNVSCLVYHLKDWPADKAAMIPPIMTHMANPYLYMSHDQLSEYLPPEAMAGLRKLE